MNPSTGLPHSRTLDDVHTAAQLAARYTRVDSVSYVDRYDDAWSAIVELLYTCPHPPSDWELLQEGRRAVFAIVREHRHHHGYYANSDTGESGPAGSMPAFNRFWWAAVSRVPPPDAGVVERVALYEILPKLSPRQREAVYALAACGDYETAAQRMGVSKDTFTTLLNSGRRRFRRWWHEGEAPSRMWVNDHRVAADGEAAGDGAERCTKGHVFTEGNSYFDRKSGKRHCRQCATDRMRRWRRRRASEAKYAA